MRVVIEKDGHRCNGMVGNAEHAYTGDNLRKEFRDHMLVILENGLGIKSITINKEFLRTL